VGTLRIPERFRAGVAAIADLTDASFNDLVQALKSSATAKTAGELSLKIADQVPSLPINSTEKIIAAISAMQSVQKTAHANSEQFTADLWDALEDDSPELVENSDENVLKERAKILLDETSIHLTSAKVTELRSEIERSFCGARILTDVRTAFPDDATKYPAMTIMQTLEIMFHDDMGRHREFYVSVDDNDLIILKDAVDRAIQKKQTLQALLTKADFELFD
jgi:hypothetical protein